MTDSNESSPTISTRGRPPVLLEYRSSTAFILSCIVLATFVDIFLYGMIVPILPFVLQSRAGVLPDQSMYTPSQSQYWVTVLLVCESAADLLTSPICGFVADRTPSRMLPFLIGLGFLVASLAMLLVARSISLFVVARIMQGIASSFVSVVGLALVVDTVEKEKMGQILGYVGLAINLGFGLGPILGGVVYDTGGYDAVIGMAFGLIGLDFILRVALIEKRVAAKWTGTDGMGSGGALGQQQSMPVRSNETSVQVKRGGGTFAILSLFRSPRLVIALWGAFVQAVVIASFDATLPIFVSTTFGWTSLGAGLIFLATVIPTFLEPFFGFLCDKYGVRILTIVSFLLAAPSLVLLRLVTHDTFHQKILLSAILALIALFMDFGFPALMVELENLVTAKERDVPGFFGRQGATAQIFGLYSMAFDAGVLVGPIWAGFMYEQHGWGTMGWSLGLLVGLTALPMMRLGDGWGCSNIVLSGSEDVPEVFELS